MMQNIVNEVEGHRMAKEWERERVQIKGTMKKLDGEGKD